MGFLNNGYIMPGTLLGIFIHGKPSQNEADSLNSRILTHKLHGTEKFSAITCKDFLSLNLAVAGCFTFMCPLLFCIAFQFSDGSVDIFLHHKGE